MDRILMESDKYMSMDSSIDDLLNDALSKRRARSIGTIFNFQQFSRNFIKGKKTIFNLLVVTRNCLCVKIGAAPAPLVQFSHTKRNSIKENNIALGVWD